jgi:BNR/Asp-box repeat
MIHKEKGMQMHIRGIGIAVAAVAAVLLWAGFATGATTQFGPPVKVTPPGGHGYEPAVYTDHYGNIFATAHKENWQLALAPDLNSPTFTRSMSWAWASSDGGQTFADLPGLTMLSAEQHDFGDEGDMAVDDANHLYFVDTNVTDVTFTSWDIFGLGQYVLNTHRPLLPAGEPVDDRPWVTAHGNGQVFYFGNEGDKDTYNNGRYTVYASHDGGQTFDSVGIGLPDSGWCRPAADHTPGSTYVYAFCGNDNGKLYSFVTADNGATWSRYDAGTYNGADGSQSWPTIEVAKDGSIWALYVDGKTDASGTTVSNTLNLYHSTDHGKTWKHTNITPMAGRYEYAWLSVSPNGRNLGIGTYYRPDNTKDWYVYGAVFGTGSKPSFVKLDPVSVQAGMCSDAPGDLMSSEFNPDGTLDVVWTRNTDPTTCGTLTVRDIYFARSH